MKKTTLLCILDGFGLNPSTEANAVAMAKKPVFDRLWAGNPHSTLVTSGERVGLPEGQMGNSEVGHLNIGAGRVVEQWLLRISRALEGPFLREAEAYRRFRDAAARGGAIHLVGLYSDGGVHSHMNHMKLLVDRLIEDFTCDIIIHLILDGRDTPPQHSLEQVSALERELGPRCKIGTVCGRFYAMDRDKRWERTHRAYDAIALSRADKAESASEWIRRSYQSGITDEFVEPAVVTHAPIGPEDAIVFWNFREDRMRQIVRALCVPSFDGFQREAPLPAPERVLCFTEYDHDFHLPYLFSPLVVANHLGEHLAKQGKSQLRVAESEKYPHVTYFFNGGIEAPYPGEERKLVPSPRDVKTYDLKPEMSALGVTDVVVDAIEGGEYDLIVVNLANCDMVGHTGVLDAAIKAVETVDACLGRMIEALQRRGGQAVIIADHGNAEQMVSNDGSPHTAHTTFPVPVMVVGSARHGRLMDGGSLCDVAPTVLHLMGVPVPAEMSGRSLFVEE